MPPEVLTDHFSTQLSLPYLHTTQNILLNACSLRVFASLTAKNGESYIWVFTVEHLCHNMMHPVLLNGDGREKKMSRTFQFGQLLQGHPNPARNWFKEAKK